MLKQLVSYLQFPGSATYWERRYARGGNSGHGSYGEYAQFKADFLNRFVCENNVTTVLEFGCGDGNQLSLAKYPRYTGVDVSPTAIRICSERFGNDGNKTFLLAGEHGCLHAELVLSLDVIFHLVEDSVFSSYMDELFASALKYVVIYSSDYEQKSPASHMRHWPVSRYVARHFANWVLTDRVPNPFPKHPTKNFAEFMVFGRQEE